LPQPIIKSHIEKSEGGLGLGEVLKIFEFPIIFATAATSDFKFGMQLGFAKAYHKIGRIRNGEHGPELEEHPKISWFPFNIYTMVEASDFMIWYTTWVCQGPS